MNDLFTLLAHAGRAAGDGLPEGATGAALLLYVAADDEAEAAREAARMLKEAGLSVLEIEGHGGLAERRAAGEEIDAAELALMERARDENSVIVAALEPLFGDVA